MSVEHQDFSVATTGQKRTGWILSGLAIAFMIFDGAIKLPPLQIVTDTMVQLGWPTSPDISRLLGLIGLISTALYAVPRTSVLGAILLTGYLGGAIATQMRIGAPLFSHTFFGLYLGALIWAGLYLRDARIRRVLPLLPE